MNSKKNEKDGLADDRQIKQFLQDYTVEYPDEQQIERTIDVLEVYLPKKKSRLFIQRTSIIMKMARQEWTHFSPLFWLANVALFFLGFLLIILGRSDAYLTMMALSPVPVILGLAELFRSWQHGMRELEMTTKYSLQQIILSRMLIVALFDLSLNLFVTAIIPFTAAGILFSRLVLYWATPFAVFSALALFIAARIRNGYATVIVMSALWSGLFSFIGSSSLFRQWLTSLQQGYFIGISVISILWLLCQVYRMSQSSRPLREKSSG